MFQEKKKIYNNVFAKIALFLAIFPSFVLAEDKSSDLMTDEMIEKEIQAALNPELGSTGEKQKSPKKKESSTMVFDNAPRQVGERSDEPSKEELKKLDLISEDPSKTRVSGTKKQTKEDRKFLYSPVDAESQLEKHDGFVVERDSSKIVKKKLAITDTLNIKLCYSAGVSVILDEDIQTEFQRIVLDDKMFFDALNYENNRGVYIRLKQPIDEGRFWESAIRLVRKDNDKEYVINLVGISCPKGMNPFPKVYYLQDKYPLITGKNTKIQTPEDTIIELSKGYPRKNVVKAEVYDLIARSGSDWAVVGIQLELDSSETISSESPFAFKILDNLQISEIPTKIEHLPLQSKKASDSLGKSMARYKLTLNLNKQYFSENRYFYIMVINEKEEYHQYIKVDSLPYILSLRKRGFDI